MTSNLMSLEAQLRPAYSALLIVDIQNDFCAPDGYLHRKRNYDVSYAPRVAANIEQLSVVARSVGAPVVWIRSIYDFKYLGEAYREKRGEEGCCLEGSWGADFFQIQPIEGDLVVDKHTFSGFYKTDLDEQLRSRGVKTLIITGVATNVCVDSTLRDGFFRGYRIVLLTDCVDSNSKVGHAGTLATVANNIGTLSTAQEVTQVLTGNKVSA